MEGLPFRGQIRIRIYYKVAVLRGNLHSKTQLDPFRRSATVHQRYGQRRSHCGATKSISK